MYLLVSGRMYLGYTSVCGVDLAFLRNHAGAFQRTWLSGTYAVL